MDGGLRLCGERAFPGGVFLIRELVTMLGLLLHQSQSGLAPNGNGSGRKCQKLRKQADGGGSKMVGCLEGEEEGMWPARLR